MPFRETCVLEETMRFVLACVEGEETMTSLCQQYGISRQWGYEMVRRYREEGAAGLEARSRAPRHPGQAMAPSIAEAVIALRVQYPSWGPRKLRAKLLRLAPETNWPAASTMGDLLRREGLVRGRRRRRVALALSRPFGAVQAANDLWCIDFKGWFRTGEGARCDPLTLTDADSRYLLACQAVRPTGAEVERVCDRVFRDHGLPQALRSDNGPPFAGTGAGGLSRLGVKWIKLGIKLEHTDLASPQQNARHERMHGTLKAETASPPAATIAAQQRRFDRFRHIFNHERPHEALGQETPASRYQPSLRRYPRRLAEPHYDATHAVRRVRSNGEIRWAGDLIFLSEVLVGESVGVAESETGDWIVSFADVPLGRIDRRSHVLRPFAPARPGQRKGHEQNRKPVNDVSGP